jgi:hypothetical protein
MAIVANQQEVEVPAFSDAKSHGKEDEEYKKRKEREGRVTAAEQHNNNNTK